jgi:hypothetical protein
MKRKIVRLPDGFNGSTVACFTDALETDGDMLKLQVAEPGRGHLFRWASKADVSNAIGSRERKDAIQREIDAIVAYPQRDLVAQWYTNLPESEAKALIGRYAGAMEYGMVRSWAKLNENVRMVLRREYRRITSKSDLALHRAVTSGLCEICGHYGDDCTGVRP